MTAKLARIERHPIKGHGREFLQSIAVHAGQTLPWDRHWAVLHEAARTDGSEWAPCANFSRGAKAPELMAIDARFDEASNLITLTHPNRPELTINPEKAEDQARFIEWINAIMPKDRAASAGIATAGARGMTDTDYPSISLLNLASIQELSDALGQPLDPRRFRGNFWVKDLGPWEEFNWIGDTIRIGDVTFRVEERIERCMATTANPKTGRRDADTLGGLERNWGHRDMGVYLTALEDGQVELGAQVTRQ